MPEHAELTWVLNCLTPMPMLELAHAYKDAVANIDLHKTPRLDDAAIPGWRTEGTNVPKEMILITQSVKELKLLMSDYVGIVRNNERLQRAMKRLDLLYTETEALYQRTIVSPQLCELRNMITVAYLIVKCAEFRHESRGLHFNTDYPAKLAMIQNIVL